VNKQWHKGGKMKSACKISKFFISRGLANIILIVVCGTFLFTMNALAENKKPVAVIDGTLEVRQGQTVYLDGSFSSAGSEGENLDYRWTLESKPGGSMAVVDRSGSEVSFKADVVGTYKVKLVVSAGVDDSDPAYAEIIVK
jgi:hypothetical protein